MRMKMRLLLVPPYVKFKSKIEHLALKKITIREQYSALAFLVINEILNVLNEFLSENMLKWKKVTNTTNMPLAVCSLPCSCVHHPT